MKRLYLPVKYHNNGLHIWCNTCNKLVTAKPCKHAERQRFQSRVCNPLTKKQDCIRSYETRDVEEAFTKHRDYIASLKQNNYNVALKPDRAVASSVQIVFLKEAAQKYLDYLQDIDVPEQEKRNLSRDYVRDCTRYVMRFLEVVRKKENKTSNFPVTSIGTEHVSDFHQLLKDEDYSQASYNAHMKQVKYFFDYIIGELDVDMKNPIEKVKLPEIHYDPQIIPVEEFEKLLSVITKENGIGTKGDKWKENVNHYRPWLKKVLVLGLLTGERLEGLVMLRWEHIEGNFFKIPNFKVNRIQKVDSYFSYTPITADLAELLLQFDVTKQEGYIVVPEMENRTTLKQFISKAFSHFWKVTGLKRDASFKTLRKTYLTRLTDAIGSKAMFVKHNNDQTAVKHYLNKKELLEQTKNVRLYGNFLD
jgi:site-specific recombinase XerD